MTSLAVFLVLFVSVLLRRSFSGNDFFSRVRLVLADPGVVRRPFDPILCYGGLSVFLRCISYFEKLFRSISQEVNASSLFLQLSKFGEVFLRPLFQGFFWVCLIYQRYLDQFLVFASSIPVVFFLGFA